jgi:hypothetical protein
MASTGTKLVESFTKERVKKGGAFALGYALGYLSHAAGLF